MVVQRYRRSAMWQKAKQLTVEVYRVTSGWPPEERYGLTSQVRRAAASVMANIAEGHGRVGSRELRHHLSIANGSVCETESFLLLGVDLRLTHEDDLVPALALSDEIGRMLISAINRIDSRGP